MAKAPTEEQSQLKRRARRRLVGSIALVTVVAVVLPWVMETEPRNGEQPIAIQIPSPESSKFDPKPTPAPAALPEQAPAAPSGAVSGGQPEQQKVIEAPTDEALRAEQDKVLSPPVKPSATKSAPAKDKGPEMRAAEPAKKTTDKAEDSADRKAPPKTAAADGKAYVVQVAALIDADKAIEIQKALAAKGLKAYTEKVKTVNGEVTRVRVGPFNGRDAAEKERARMKSLGFDGNVAPK
jgi:DedD protein